MYITFRMDDICPQMNMSKFMKYKQLFDDYGVKPLLGIVPDNQAPKLAVDQAWPGFWELKRQLQDYGWSIAQHGYQHVYCSRHPGLITSRPLSEFAGLPYAEQYQKIELGRTILQEQGIKTDIFMAPGHSFDTTTLQALKDCGFIYVTDGHSSWPYVYKGIKFIPCRNLTP